MIRPLLSLACASALLPAAFAQLQGPVSGVLFDEGARSFKQILGMPGGATLGPDVPLPHGFRLAVVSPQGSFALGVADDDAGALMLVAGLLGSEPVARALEGAAAAPDAILFNPSGTAALLIHNGRGSLQLVRGLPDAPLVSVSFDLPFTAAVAALADSGRVLAAEPALEGRAALHLLDFHDDAYSSTIVHYLEQPGPMLFMRDSARAAVVDGRRLLLLRGIGSDVAIDVLASEADGVSRIVGLGQSRDGGSLVFADADSRQVTTVHLEETWRRQVIVTPTAPARCEALSTGGLFLLAHERGSPLYLLNLDPLPGVFFVPAQQAHQ